MTASAPRRFRDFAHAHHLEGFTDPALLRIRAGDKGGSVDRARRYLDLQARIERAPPGHQITSRNPHTAWFRCGEQSLDQARAFIVRCSVFSNLFLVARLRKAINADSCEMLDAVAVCWCAGSARTSSADASPW
ncbi:MAG: hypothetical protein LJE91_13485 [Gammaproteobacteria bacterium]|jgi:hypothetical protein|nr:hypothetical protein [Gammaproteobacteria bacterium]